MKIFSLIATSFLAVFVSPFNRGVQGSMGHQAILDTIITVTVKAKFIGNLSIPFCSCYGINSGERNIFEIVPSFQNGQLIKRIIIEYAGCKRNYFTVGKSYKIIAMMSPLRGCYENISTIPEPKKPNPF